MKLSVVIPAYNESDNIKKTIEELISIIEKIDAVDGVEIIVVDDHSSDNTFDIIKGINDPKISCLRLSRPSGSHTAIRAGFIESRGDAAVYISADGQDNPVTLKYMVEKWQQGAKVVWALRRDRKIQTRFIRWPAQFFYNLLRWLLKNKKSDIDLSRADFFLLDRIVINAINACPERNTSIFGLIVWLGFTQDFVECDKRNRISGSSKWNFKSRYHLAKDWIIAFSGLPLRIASSLGILMSALGMLGIVYVVLNKIFNKLIPGWTSIVVLILLLGGIQLIILGIFGEYLWRNLDETRKRPIFFIEKKSSK